MSSLIEEIVKGRKTFFIAPDKSLFPESYLEEYLNLGYECYFIETDLFLPVFTKIDIIMSIFKDSVLIFNIDAPLQTNENWPSIIKKAQLKYPDACFGVMYAKKPSQMEKSLIEQQYIMNIGIRCGCIQLEYQKKNNFGIIEKALYANQAMGRRKNVRACCSSSCIVKFTNKEDVTYTVRLNDISISHFSVTINSNEHVVFTEYEKIFDAQFTIKGLHFSSDAVLFISRPADKGTLYVFTFSTKKGLPGLDPMNKQLLVPKIYSIMVENCQELLGKLFRTALEHRTAKTTVTAEDIGL